MNQIENILKKIKEYALLNKVPIIQKEAALYLSDLVITKQPKRILEIGTAIGYSAILMAKNITDNAKITTIEKDLERIEKATSFILEAELSNKIEVRYGDAAEIIPSLNDSFDFVFLDAAKGQYLNHLQKIIPKLEDTSIIIADNVLFRGFVLNKSIENQTPKKYRTIVRRLKEYINFVQSDKSFKTEIIEKADGLAVSYYTKER